MGSLDVSYTLSDTFESLFAKIGADLQGKALVVKVVNKSQEDGSVAAGVKDIVFTILGDGSGVDKVVFSGQDKATFWKM